MYVKGKSLNSKGAKLSQIWSNKTGQTITKWDQKRADGEKNEMAKQSQTEPKRSNGAKRGQTKPNRAKPG